MRTLVAYFSASGITEGVAQEIARVAHADLLATVPQTPYTAVDLDWNNPKSRSTVEMKDLSFRPPIKETPLQPVAYDVVLLGFPIWWSTASTIIHTFLETYNMADKVIIPFATSGGTTIEKTLTDLKRSYPNLNWKAGKLLNRSNRHTLESWCKEIGIL